MFEYGCEFQMPWVALDTLDIHPGREDSSVVYRAMPGDSLQFLGGDLVVEALGRVLIEQPLGDFAPGDTVFITGCDAEGWCSTWTEHGEGAMEQLWCGDTSAVRLLEPRRETWWVQVSLESGRTGWLALRNTEECGFVFPERIEVRWRWK